MEPDPTAVDDGPSPQARLAVDAPARGADRLFVVWCLVVASGVVVAAWPHGWTARGAAAVLALVLALVTVRLADRHHPATRDESSTDTLAATLDELRTQVANLTAARRDRDELDARRHEELLETIRTIDARPAALRKLRNLLGVPEARD